MEGRVRCETCCEAKDLGVLRGAKQSDAFVTTGFGGNWKRALEKFSKHERSDTHVQALTDIKTRKRDNLTMELLLAGSASERVENTKALAAILDTIIAVAAQGLPFRRNEETKGNFRRMLDLVARYESALRTWLEQGKGDHAYLSHQIQEELLKMLSIGIQRKLAEEVKAAGPFAIMVDETADIKRTEQVSICFRFVDEDLTIHELFAGLYAAPDTSAETITKIVLDVLQQRWGLDPSNLRGQCFDGAANMAGCFTGQ